MSAYIDIVDKFSETVIYFVLAAHSVFFCLFFFFIILIRTHAPGEHVLYETLHTKLGMENRDIEEVC